MLSGSQKVERAHLERLAIVYLRQSSPRQVRENFRSTERQYGLAEKAAQLGWEPARVLTVDGDLGISGRGTHAREAYKELVGRVCLGEVGAIFGLEVARLARNNAELLRLLEFCAVTDTLVVDTDGIYDLKDFNDRTILGLKAQWSEAELHIMASRLQGAKRHAAERGELRLPLPIGYLYDDEGEVIIDPDEEVQAAVSDLFKAFAQTGSAYGVVGAFKDRRFPKRATVPWDGRVRWERLRYSRVRQVLTNPCYAGAYAFGRHRSRRAVTPDGTIVTKKVAAAPRRMGGSDSRPPPGLHQLGCVPGQRGTPRRQPHRQRPAPRARGWRALPRDRQLRLLRAHDGNPLPARSDRLQVLALTP